MNKKNFKFVLDDGSEVELKDLVSAGLAESLEGMGFNVVDGKVNLADISAKTRSAIEEKYENAKLSQKFIKDLFEGKAIDSTGGSFGPAVPTQLYNSIIAKRDSIAMVRKFATALKQNGTLQLPTDGTMVSAAWYGENTSVTEGAPTLALKALKDNYLSGFVKIPYALLNGSPIALENYIAELVGRAIALKEEEAFVAGSGTGQPTGIRATSGVTAVAQAGANMAYDDLIEVFHTLAPQYRASDKVVFVTSSKGIKLARKLKDTTGAPIFDPTQNTLLGKPVIESPYIPSNLGAGTNETEIWIVDLAQYWIKDGENLTVKTTDAPKNLQVELVAYQATDGGLLFSEAAAKLTGVK